jgi:hypothetical protein
VCWLLDKEEPPPPLLTDNICSCSSLYRWFSNLKVSTKIYSTCSWSIPTFGRWFVRLPKVKLQAH